MCMRADLDDNGFASNAALPRVFEQLPCGKDGPSPGGSFPAQAPMQVHWLRIHTEQGHWLAGQQKQQLHVKLEVRT